MSKFLHDDDDVMALVIPWVFSANSQAKTAYQHFLFL